MKKKPEEEKLSQLTLSDLKGKIVPLLTTDQPSNEFYTVKDLFQANGGNHPFIKDIVQKQLNNYIKAFEKKKDDPEILKVTEEIAKLKVDTPAEEQDVRDAEKFFEDQLKLQEKLQEGKTSEEVEKSVEKSVETTQPDCKNVDDLEDDLPTVEEATI